MLSIVSILEGAAGISLRTSGALLAQGLLQGCVLSQHMEPPAPREFVVSAPPDSVLAAADTLLSRAGWITETRDRGMTLRGEHKGRGDENGDWLTCESGVGRHGDTRRATRDLRSVVAVLVETSHRDGATNVRIV